MKVTLIIPTKNEEGCIGRVLQEVPKKYVDEILVVDGYSKDNTVKEAKANLRQGKDKIVMQKSKGYGGAFIEGMAKASGDVIVMMDADGNDVATLEAIKNLLRLETEISSVWRNGPDILIYSFGK